MLRSTHHALFTNFKVKLSITMLVGLISGGSRAQEMVVKCCEVINEKPVQTVDKYLGEIDQYRYILTKELTWKSISSKPKLLQFDSDFKLKNQITTPQVYNEKSLVPVGANLYDSQITLYTYSDEVVNENNNVFAHTVNPSSLQIEGAPFRAGLLPSLPNQVNELRNIELHNSINVNNVLISRMSHHKKENTLGFDFLMITNGSSVWSKSISLPFSRHGYKLLNTHVTADAKAILVLGKHHNKFGSKYTDIQVVVIDSSSVDPLIHTINFPEKGMKTVQTKFNEGMNKLYVAGYLFSEAKHDFVNGSFLKIFSPSNGKVQNETVLPLTAEVIQSMDLKQKDIKKELNEDDNKGMTNLYLIDLHILPDGGALLCGEEVLNFTPSAQGRFPHYHSGLIQCINSEGTIKWSKVILKEQFGLGSYFTSVEDTLIKIFYLDHSLNSSSLEDLNGPGYKPKLISMQNNNLAHLKWMSISSAGEAVAVGFLPAKEIGMYINASEMVKTIDGMLIVYRESFKTSLGLLKYNN